MKYIVQQLLFTLRRDVFFYDMFDSADLFQKISRADPIEHPVYMERYLYEFIYSGILMIFRKKCRRCKVLIYTWILREADLLPPAPPLSLLHI